MSLVDITPLPAEDEIMDPTIKQFVESSVTIAEARSDAKLAEFRATMEAYTARAEEREAAARERAEVREVAARERAVASETAWRESEKAAREQAAASEAAWRESEKAARERAAASEAAWRESEKAARDREDARFAAFERRMDDHEARANERHAAYEARFDRIEKRLDLIEASIVSMKRFIVGASLSTVLGVAAFNAALIQNYHSAFDSARHLSAAEKDLQEQRKRSDALMSALEARLAAMQQTSGQKPPSP